MTVNQLDNIEQLEASLWDAADNLRANSKLTAGEYCMPVLGVIFLRHATNRYVEALREIQTEQAAGKIPKRPLTAADFKKRRALLLPKEARYDELLKLPKGSDLGAALVAASAQSRVLQIHPRWRDGQLQGCPGSAPRDAGAGH